MATKANPYGPAHQKRRHAILGPFVRCVYCGQPGTTVLDHQPSLKLHEHIEGSGCCRVLPSCTVCSSRQGQALSTALLDELPPQRIEVADPDGIDADDPRWDVPWLTDLRDVPPEGTWPRLMTVPHPAAVGSYGLSAALWLEQTAGLTLRWWQRLALTRELEHDAEGNLVWLEVLLTTARQVGKSTKLRGSATWRLHQAGLFGEEQTLLHTGKDLPVCKEVQRLARAWAKARDYPVREQNGNEQITEPLTGSRWIVRGKGSVYGYPASYVLVDEAWGVMPEVVDDGLEPTMAERISPQMVLASTAHSKATPLFLAHRTAALAELGAPGSTLLIEWSAKRGSDIDDRKAWREASPHWSQGRERLLEARLKRVQSGESLDDDESDPVESFRTQFLNIWPARTTTDPGEVLIDPAVWSALTAKAEHAQGTKVFVAVEDHFGKGAAVAAVAKAVDGRFEVDGWLVESWAEAFADVEMLCATRNRKQVMVGSTLASQIEPRLGARTMTAADTRAGLALIRQLAVSGRLFHDTAPELDQLTQVRVREMPSGMTIVAGHRADLTRAASWALLAAHEAAAEPAIH